MVLIVDIVNNSELQNTVKVALMVTSYYCLDNGIIMAFNLNITLLIIL